MNDVKISLYKKSFKSKPTKAETALLSKIIAEKAITINQSDIEAFVKLVGGHGYTFCPATFTDGKRRKENFEQTQLLTLDFDGGISFDEVKRRADRYDLPMLFAYNTFSSNNYNNKFRAVFLNDASIPDGRAAGAMLQALTTIFDESDASCSKDIARMYFGGVGLLHFDDTVPNINAESLFRNLSLYLKDRYGSTNYKRKIAEFSQKSGIKLKENNLLDIYVTESDAEDTGNNPNDKISPSPSMIYRIGKKLLNYHINFNDKLTSTSAIEKKSSAHLEYRSSALKNIQSDCRLYQEFENGSRRLHHNELFGLATNLIQVESGARRFKDIIKSHSYFEDRLKKYDDWNYYLFYMKGYKPYSCDGFCPYSNECSHGSNVLATVKVGYRQMERLSNYAENYVSLEEAVDDFKTRFLQAVNAAQKKWYIIKAQTALGKTQIYLEMLKDTSMRVLIAVPTNILKREVCERAKEMGIDLIVSPSLHELEDELPDDVWCEIQSLLNSGKSAMGYIRKTIDENHYCSSVLQQYLDDLDEFNNSNGCAITTHKRLLTMREEVEKYDLVIVDEDIIFNSIIPNRSSISISDLKKLLKKISPASPLAGKIRGILKAIKTEEYFTVKGIRYDKKAYGGIKMEVDIPSLCATKYFCFRSASNRDNDLEEDIVSFTNPVKFSKNTKFIMVSATVNEQICEYYFKNDMEFYECSQARYKGTVCQYYDRSYSRADIKKDPSIIALLKSHSEFKYTISFKMFSKYYDGDLYYGNCAGCDYLKGENIDVIGVPHQPEWIYKLFACSLGLGFNTDETIKPGITVEHNGYRFRFTTYDDKVLRAIQFYMIESDLEQVVGRARLLRKPCTVNVYSAFPLRQAVMQESEYGSDTKEQPA